MIYLLMRILSVGVFEPDFSLGNLPSVQDAAAQKMCKELAVSKEASAHSARISVTVDSEGLIRFGAEEQALLAKISREIFDMVSSSPSISFALNDIIADAKVLLDRLEYEREGSGLFKRLKDWRRRKQTAFDTEAFFISELRDYLNRINTLKANWDSDQNQLYFVETKLQEIEIQIESIQQRLEENIEKLIESKRTATIELSQLGHQIAQFDGDISHLKEIFERLNNIKKSIEDRISDHRMSLTIAQQILIGIRGIKQHQGITLNLMQHVMLGSLSPAIVFALESAARLEAERDRVSHEASQFPQISHWKSFDYHRLGAEDKISLTPIYNVPILYGREVRERGGEKIISQDESIYFIHATKGLIHINLSERASMFERQFPHQVVGQLKYDYDFNPLTISADGKWLAQITALDDGRIQTDIIDRKNGYRVLTFSTRYSVFRSSPVIFLPGDQFLIAGDRNASGTPLELWDINQRVNQKTFYVSAPIEDSFVSKEKSMVILKLERSGMGFICLQTRKLTKIEQNYDFIGENENGIYMKSGYGLFIVQRKENRSVFDRFKSPFDLKEIYNTGRTYFREIVGFNDRAGLRKVVLNLYDSLIEFDLKTKISRSIRAENNPIYTLGYSEEGKYLYLISKDGAFMKVPSIFGDHWNESTQRHNASISASDFVLDGEQQGIDKWFFHAASAGGSIINIPKSSWLISRSSNGRYLSLIHKETGDSKSISFSDLIESSFGEDGGHFAQGKIWVHEVNDQLFLLVTVSRSNVNDSNLLIFKVTSE